MTPRLLLLAFSILLASAVSRAPAEAAAKKASEPDDQALVEAFFDLASDDPAEYRPATRTIRDAWAPGFTAMSLEIMRLAGQDARVRIVRLLEKATGERFGGDRNAWWQWVWSRPPGEHSAYPMFKAQLYRLLDPRFEAYFDGQSGDGEFERTIRLDEVRWGGVVQDGIPPLRSPKMIGAAEASYLEDDHVVFGLEIEGDARAYPKRILAWHEMFTDEVGGRPVAGVYCTLCGTMILYETRHEGAVHGLGTSGFLYRSNKLMYDQATQSLWSTIEGEPVIGPLVGKGIRLKLHGVVTTTWGEWQRRHPETRVLSLDTGHARDYSEGAAYREYFATDELMFTVPELDRRLPNKAEVLALDLEPGSAPPLAIDADYLRQHPVLDQQVGEQRFVVLTDGSGANRVYERVDAQGEVRFASFDGDRIALDTEGRRWQASEAGLEAEDGRTLARLPAHRAFWFGWRAAHPDTRLIR